MQTELNEVSLVNLGNGAAVELFTEELGKVLQNIADPNTPWKETRVIDLRVKVTPSSEERSGAFVEISAGSKLAHNKPFATHVLVGIDGQEIKAYENAPAKQPVLPGLDDKIVNIGGKK